MHRNEYKQYLTWQSTGKGAPPRLNERVRYYYLKKPDWEKLFKSHSNFPEKPNKVKKSKSFGDYLFSLIENIFEDIGPAIGLFMFVGLPILMIDYVFTKGLLTISIVGVGYFFYNK